MKNDFKKVEDNITNLSDTISKLTEQIGPLLDFTDLGKQIENLKNTTATMGKEGEGDVTIVDLVEKYEDDADLGKALRELYNKYYTTKEANTEK
tara:strand:+ start:286 stop:567 length:282 start_codon:yes stop_codon:yes gene_type:complete